MNLLPANEVAAPDGLIRRAPDESPGAERGTASGRKASRGEAFKYGVERAIRRNRHRLAFAGVVLFSLLLYLRPQDIFPEVIGTFPLVKIVGIATLAAYVLSRLHWGEKITILPLELKMVMLIFTLGWVMAPFALEPGRSVETLTDTYLKVMLVFMLMINLLDNRKRLLLMIKAVMLCGGVVAVGAIKSYQEGKFSIETKRIEGMVGGLFGNPNDLATGLDLMIPLAVILALTQRGIWRFLSLACAAVMALGVVVTFSRGGFLGLMLSGGLLVWKLGERNRARTVILSLVAAGMLALAIPGSYFSRLSTILDTKSDETGSAQERRALLDRAIWLAVHRPIIGVGVSNFLIYSVNQRVAHNSYLEISAELGVAGLIAYLILIIAPLKSCRLIERQTKPDKETKEPWIREERDPAAFRRREIYYLSIGLQATLYAYILCSFFASIQYFWYLYYPVAYVVALGRIKEAEESQEAASPLATAQPVQVDEARSEGRARSGVLWKSSQTRKGMNGTEISRKQSYLLGVRNLGRLFTRR